MLAKMNRCGDGGLAQATAAASAAGAAQPQAGSDSGNDEVVDAEFEAVDENPPG